MNRPSRLNISFLQRFPNGLSFLPDYILEIIYYIYIVNLILLNYLFYAGVFSIVSLYLMFKLY